MEVKQKESGAKAVKQRNKSIDYIFTPDTERLIEMVNTTMAMESMPLIDEDRDRLRAILRGEITAEETVRQLVNKHRRSADAEFLRV